jgi:hypothetical protein
MTAADTKANETVSEKLTKIRKECEALARDRRKIANEPIIHDPEDKDDRTDAEKLRSRVWGEYYYERGYKICSRCGNYSRYEIIPTKIPTNRDLNEHYGLDFHNMDYKINTIRVLNKNSNDSDWGNICNKCRLHIMGKIENLLDNSLSKAENELGRLKQKERTRRMFQDDEIREAAAALRKENKEKAEANGTYIPPRSHHKRRKTEENWRAEKQK